MSSFKPESDVFEITDFTNATEWETFTTKLENILYSLGVTNKQREDEDSFGLTGDEHVSTHEVDLRSHKFDVSLLCAKSAGDNSVDDVQFILGDEEHDFPTRSHCLTRWFGLKKFVIMSPAGDSPFSVTDLSLATQLLSSLALASGQTKCIIPLFVQVQRSKRRMYDGVWLSGDGLRTDFSVLELHQTPVQYGHLAGLMDIFKAELRVLAPPPATVSIRFTYLLNGWPSRDMWANESQLCDLTFGGSTDSLMSLQLSATWPSVREDSVVDNSVYSDLDPVKAPRWMVRALFQDTDAGGHLHAARHRLSSTLSDLLQLCQRSDGLGELLGRNAYQDDEPSAEMQENVRHALHRMTAPAMRAPTLSSLVRNAVTSSALEDLPLETEMLDSIVGALFPDVDTQSSSQPDELNDAVDHDDTAFRRVQYKACPSGSLLVRVACVLLKMFRDRGGLRALAHVWREFVLELRHRYEHNALLVDIPQKTSPDMRHCLLQQKLQMLQCCIERKCKRVVSELAHQCTPAKPLTVPSPVPMGCDVSAEDSSDDDDEFFEAMEEQKDSSMDLLENAKGGDSEGLAETPESDTNVPEAEGVYEVSPNLTLLVTGKPLSIPITQEITPLTEDMLAEQQEMLAGLGTSEVARQLRARMQSTQLLADMEAFKAANPGCILGDFVRWYSPRDWIESSPPSSGDESEEARESDVCEAAEKSSPGSWDQSEWDVVTSDDVTVSEDPSASGTAQEGQDYGGCDPLAPGAAVEDISEGGMANLDNADAVSSTSEGDELVEDQCHDLAGDASLQEANSSVMDCEEPEPAQYTGGGQLSIRMRDPSTLWHQTWTSAQAVPAYRQRRLFDDTLEAEKVFHYLEKLTVGQLMMHVAPIIVQRGIELLRGLPEAKYEAVASALDSCSEGLARVYQTSVECFPQLYEAVRHLSKAEALTVRIQSLASAVKFGREQYQVGGRSATAPLTEEEQRSWIAHLIDHCPMELDAASRHPLGVSLCGLAMAQVEQRQPTPDKAPSAIPKRTEAVGYQFPPPAAREFIIRHHLPRPSPQSRPTVQRMFAVLSEKEFRLATAFTTDMMFI